MQNKRQSSGTQQSDTVLRPLDLVRFGLVLKKNWAD